MFALLEGAICAVMFAPLGLALSSLGGVLGGSCARYLSSRRSRTGSVACIIILPFLVAPVEKPLLYRCEHRTVENFIDIHAPAGVVWRNTERVPLIRPDELPSSWSHRIGFPDRWKRLCPMKESAASAMHLSREASCSLKPWMFGNRSGD